FAWRPAPVGVVRALADVGLLAIRRAVPVLVQEVVPPARRRSVEQPHHAHALDAGIGRRAAQLGERLGVVDVETEPGLGTGQWCERLVAGGERPAHGLLVRPLLLL